MKALFELFRRFDARRIFGFIRRLGGMSRPKVKCYDLRSTHALRVEGDLFPVARKDAFHISIHALRVEGDFLMYIASTAEEISIHALRVEGDDIDAVLTAAVPDFYPRPPGGGRLSVHSKSKIQKHFYPRPPGGGRLASGSAGRSYVSNFYPRPPGGGRRRVAIYGRRCWIISIHALRVEGDNVLFLATIKLSYFYPRPPGGGRQRAFFSHDQALFISIHALRVEGDNDARVGLPLKNTFLSTPSGWRATGLPNTRRQSVRFLSTPSGWRATSMVNWSP